MASPIIDDLELKAVQQIRQETDQDFARHRIAGLDGTVHQKLGRRSHRVMLSGVLLPGTAMEDLKTLQQKASSGDEVTFSADITTALEVQKMVIESFRAEQQVGRAGQIHYAIVLAESPPLPPPAQVSAFGGLDDFGLGDLGFDPGALDDVVGDIAEQAGSVMDAVDTALGAVEQLQALKGIADFAASGNPLRPLADRVGELSALKPGARALADAVRGLTG